MYEPEFRILLVIPQLVFGCAGLFGFGITSNHVTHWFLPDFFFALEVMGMVIGAVASALYIVDAHRALFPSFLSSKAKLSEAISLLKHSPASLSSRTCSASASPGARTTG